MAGALTQVAVAGASTWAVGQVFRSHFAEQRPARDLDPEAVRGLYRRYFERAREQVPEPAPRRAEPVPRRARPIRRVNRILARLERMLEEGVIDRPTFLALREQTLSAL